MVDIGHVIHVTLDTFDEPGDKAKSSPLMHGMKLTKTQTNLLYMYHVPFCHVAGEDDFHDLYRELVTIKANYYQLGIGLGLPPGELQTICKGAQCIEQAFTEVLLAWLRQCYKVERFGSPTWRRLVEAVDSPAGGNNHALAKELANKHSIIGENVYYDTCTFMLCVNMR